MMRLYWPKETPPSILPPGKGTWEAAWCDAGVVNTTHPRTDITGLIQGSGWRRSQWTNSRDGRFERY